LPHNTRVLARLAMIMLPMSAWLGLIGTPSPCSANRFISVDLGHFSTTSSKFKSGFIYGAGLTEGKGKVGFGITALRFASTSEGAEVSVDTEGKIIRADFDEHLADFVLSVMALYRLNKVERQNHVMLGAGPQVHFLNSTRAFSAFEEGARDFRMGAGAFIRYQRRLDMFGDLGFVLSASYSHMQSVGKRTDQYDVPTAAMNVTTVTAGLAFPF
jgi:hypothetical protein